jgi:hypothetical protein
MARFEGGCLCGAVRFSLDGDSRMNLACHCSDCTRYNGGAPAYEAVFERTAFALTKGAPRAYAGKGDSGRGIVRHFCADCGTPLYVHLEKLPRHIVMAAGAIYDFESFIVKAHIFSASAQPWHLFVPDADKFPGDFPPAPAKAS